MKQILSPLANDARSAKADGFEEFIVASAKLAGLQACCATAGFETVDGWFWLANKEPGKRTRIGKNCSFQAKHTANASTTSVTLSSLEFDFLMILVAQDVNEGHRLNFYRTFYLIPREAIEDEDLRQTSDGKYDFQFSASPNYEQYRDLPKSQLVGVWEPVIHFFTREGD